MSTYAQPSGPLPVLLLWPVPREHVTLATHNPSTHLRPLLQLVSLPANQLNVIPPIRLTTMRSTLPRPVRRERKPRDVQRRMIKRPHGVTRLQRLADRVETLIRQLALLPRRLAYRHQR